MLSPCHLSGPGAIHAVPVPSVLSHHPTHHHCGHIRGWGLWGAKGASLILKGQNIPPLRGLSLVRGDWSRGHSLAQGGTGELAGLAQGDPTMGWGLSPLPLGCPWFSVALAGRCFLLWLCIPGFRLLLLPPGPCPCPGRAWGAPAGPREPDLLLVLQISPTRGSSLSWDRS